MTLFFPWIQCFSSWFDPWPRWRWRTLSWWHPCFSPGVETPRWSGTSSEDSTLDIPQQTLLHPRKHANNQEITFDCAAKWLLVNWSPDKIEPESVTWPDCRPCFVETASFKVIFHLNTVVDKELWTSLNSKGGTVIYHVENPKKNKNNENWEKLHL